MTKIILGISAFYHDSAAALIQDGVIVAAVQEERFTRRKFDAHFPLNAIRYCLDEAQIALSDVDHVVFFEKPGRKFQRIMSMFKAHAPVGLKGFLKAFPLWAFSKRYHRKALVNWLTLLGNPPHPTSILFSDHHLSPAASAFFPSPFEKALVITIDAVGEWATTSIGIGDKNTLKLEKEIHFPHSLGMFYSAFTDFCGFKVNSGEYKLMGLAPYGKPVYAGKIRDHLISLKDDGSYQINQTYFSYATGGSMTNAHFAALFGLTRRVQESDLTQPYMDLAASVQLVIEEAILNIVEASVRETGLRNVCLAGGVALNCVANGKLIRSGLINDLWIQPAAGDAGGALGAALAYHYIGLGHARKLCPPDSMQGSFLGPSFTTSDVRSFCNEVGAPFAEFENEETYLERVVDALVAGQAIGWFSGRMEYGPRALGARSIIADPRSAEMRKNLNLKVKFRESFRPFAPIVLAERASEWFDANHESPYMLLVADVNSNRLCTSLADMQGLDLLDQKRSEIPATTHVDNSARLQTISSDRNVLLHKLLSRFYERTGCPVLVNTSFNVRGEPIVCTPKDAYRCFMGTHLDMLAIEGLILHKDVQPDTLRKSYEHLFDLD